jgi:glycosyltransferase involved in cell wall biosynthesis
MAEPMTLGPAALAHRSAGGPSLRVLHITELFPPDYAGGVGIYVRDICRYLTDRGHEVRVLAVEKADREPYTVRTDHDGLIRVDRINLPYIAGTDPEGWGLGLFRWIAHQRRLVRILRERLDEWMPDLVHCHLPRLLGEECLIDIHRRGIPLVWMLHDYWTICVRMQLVRSPTRSTCAGPAPLRCCECVYSHYDGARWRAWAKMPWRLLKLGPLPAYKVWRRRVLSRCGRGANGGSEFLARTLRSYLPGLVEHTPLGIDLTGLPSERTERPPGPIRFGFVAGFQVHKGIWHVLDAVAALKRRGMDCELHVWGPGSGPAGRHDGWALPPAQNVREVEARGIDDRVFLHGMYSDGDQGRVFSSVDVALMATTVQEPFGRVVKEAAACGVPTIAPATGGITEQIRDGVDGLLYRFRDPADLERQMARVVRDPDLVRLLSANATPPPDTREAVAMIEEFYFRSLGQAAARS